MHFQAPHRSRVSMCLSNRTTVNGNLIKRQNQNLVKYINKKAIKNGMGLTHFQKLASSRKEDFPSLIKSILTIVLILCDTLTHNPHTQDWMSRD